MFFFILFEVKNVENFGFSKYEDDIFKTMSSAAPGVKAEGAEVIASQLCDLNYRLSKPQLFNLNFAV